MEFGWTPGPAVVFPFASLLKILLFSSLYLFYLNCDRCAAEPQAQAAAGAGAKPGGSWGGVGAPVVPHSVAARSLALPTDMQVGFCGSAVVKN